MTTITFDGKTLAADSQCTIGNTPTRTTKIHTINDCMVATCGTVSVTRELLAWYRAGAIKEEYPELATEEAQSQLLVIQLVDSKPVLSLYSDSPYPVTFENQQFAIGSGGDFAMGAMKMGADAIKATEIACELDVFSSGPINYLTWSE